MARHLLLIFISPSWSNPYWLIRWGSINKLVSYFLTVETACKSLSGICMGKIRATVVKAKKFFLLVEKKLIPSKVFQRRCKDNVKQILEN
jgi:hypothetical protein